MTKILRRETEPCRQRLIPSRSTKMEGGSVGTDSSLSTRDATSEVVSTRVVETLIKRWMSFGN